MQIELNGDCTELPPGTHVAGLLEQLNKANLAVAVEVNGQLVPRAKHAACVLRPGDSVEVVTLVGGG